MATLRLEIVTPEARVFSDDVDSVVLPGVEGELGILPQHIPLLTMIKPGELRAHQKGQTLDLATGEGFVEITGDRVIVLTDMALKAEDIDESKVEEALLRAQQALAEKQTSSAEMEALGAMIQKSIAQLNFKRKRR
ncbi:MAG: F0F1 ATP synthase subunit epsilon [bacterium]